MYSEVFGFFQHFFGCFFIYKERENLMFYSAKLIVKKEGPPETGKIELERTIIVKHPAGVFKCLGEFSDD